MIPEELKHANRTSPLGLHLFVPNRPAISERAVDLTVQEKSPHSLESA